MIILKISVVNMLGAYMKSLKSDTIFIKKNNIFIDHKSTFVTGGFSSRFFLLSKTVLGDNASSLHPSSQPDCTKATECSTS